MKKSFHVFFLFTLVAFFVTMANAGQVTLTPDQDGDYVNMPYINNTEVIDTLDLREVQGVTTFKVYDNGGKNGNYSNVSNAYLVLLAPDGYLFSISGNVDTEFNFDFLRIHNGGPDGNTLLNQSGANTNIGTVFSSGDVVTLYFRSDGGDNQSGLNLTVSLIDASTEYDITVNSVDGGSVEVENGKTSAKVGETVTLTVSANSNYMLKGIEVKGTEDNIPVNVSGGQWYSGSNTVSFVMPNKAVTVTPQFTDNPTAEGGLVINVPTDKSDLVVGVPEGVSSFKVGVEEAGESGFGGYVGRLEMTAPDGFLFQVSGLSGEMMTYALQVEELENSGDYGGTCLWGPRYGCPADETILSTGRIIRLSLQQAVPIEFTVKLVDATKDYAVNVATGIVGGSIVSDKNSAKPGEIVELTVSPAENYLLDHIGVVDSNGSAIQAPLMSWYTAATASLRMPPTHITVTPVFTNDFSNLSINMPSTEGSLLEVNIPAAVSSFKVYDDGGENGHANGGGMLVLTAPAGKVLQVSGSVTFGGRGSIAIFDGLYNPSPYGQSETPEPLDYSNASASIAPVASSGNVITISFTPLAMYGGGGDEGDNDLDLTVTVMDAPDPNVITLVQKTGGTIVASASEARLGEKVTMTVTCDDSYLLDGISVVDVSGNPVAVTGGLWYDGSASFKMPMTAVTVTPSFVQGKKSVEDGLFINLPLTSMGMDYPVVHIPEGVKSFKVYDDGGANAAYVASGSEAIQLVAPSGYLLRVTGSTDLGSGAQLYVNPDESSNLITGVKSDIGTYEGSQMTLRLSVMGYVIGGGNEHAGLDLTVELVKTTQYAAVTVEEVGATTTATIDGSYTDAGEVIIASDVVVDTVVFNRDFTTGKYSTIVLPFSIKAGQVEGAEFYHLTGFEKVDGKWKTALISKVNDNDNLVANTPYLLEASKTNLIFKSGGVPLTLNTTEKHPYTFASEDGSGYWEFRGTYEYIDYANDLPELLGRAYGFAAKEKNNYKVGDFARLKAGANTPAMRAYLVYNDGPMPQGGESMPKSTLGSGIPSDLPETLEVVIVNDEGKSIGGGTINTVTGQIRMNHWYDLQGRKLNGKPTTKGTYYHKGKLVIIK